METNVVRKKVDRRLLFLEIVMIIAAIIFIYPAVLILLNSFKTDSQVASDPIGFPLVPTIQNYISIWNLQNFPKFVLNTFILTSFSTAGIVLVSSMAAYILARTRSKLSWILFGMFAFSMIIPFQTIMVPLTRLAIDFRLTNIWGMIPMYIGLGCPMAIFLYHGFMRTIPLELEESAAIDGANLFRTFFTIVFPLLTPITATVVILDVLWIWNDFLLPLIIIKKGTLQLLQYSLMGTFRQEWGRATAAVILSALPVIIFYFALQKYIVKGISSGAVKG